MRRRSVFINKDMQSMPAKTKRQKLIEIFSEEPELEDTPLESVNISTSSVSLASLNLPGSNSQSSTTTMEIDPNPVDYDIMKIPGQIKHCFPDDIITQRSVKSLLDKPMPLTVKNKKLQKYLILGKKPKTNEEYSKEFYEYIMSLSTRIVESDTD